MGIKDVEGKMINNYINIGSAGVIRNEEMYFCPIQFNALCRTDLNTGKTEFLGHFEEKLEEKLYRKAFIYKDDIWFIPWKADKIACVDLSSLTIDYYQPRYITESKIGCEVEKCAYLSSGVYENRYLYLVPTKYDTPIVIDMENRAFQSYEGVLDVEGQAYGYGVVSENVFWISPHTGDKLVQLNIQDGEINTIDWDYDSLQYRGMCDWDNKIWFAPGKDENRILFFDKNDKSWGMIKIEDECSKGSSYNECLEIENGIAFLPYESKSILVIKRDIKGFSVANVERTDKYYGLRRLGISDDIFLAEENSPTVYKMNQDGIVANVCNATMESSEKAKMMKYSNNLITEGKYTLMDYLEYMNQL